MKRIFWLASYPKSGNTWFRVFYTNLIKNSDRPAIINELESDGIASSRDLFDEAAGICSSDMTHDEIDRMRPGVYETLSEDSDETIYMKIHDAYTMTEKGHPLVSEKATLGALYFIRNPLDVAISFAHHNANSIEKMIGKMADDSYAFCDKNDRLHNQLRQRLLSWRSHVLSWVEAPELNLHIVRYEDMLHHKEATFTKAAKFAGLPDDPARIQKALAFSRIEELQAQEKEQGFQEKNPRATSFFRKGETGSWRETLTEEQTARIINDHQDVMQRFGYLTDAGEPVF